MKTKPRRLATTCVKLAAHVLPRGAVRERYERELVAELYAATPWQAPKYVLGVLATALQLRQAVVAGTDPGEVPFARAGIPLRCRLNLSHKWHLRSTDDGGLFKECARCHREGAQGFAGVWHYPGDDARRSFTA
jgi:hypothetical protein